MPLDNSLNQDIKLAHMFHCAITSDLPAHDERKFSNSTPKIIARGIKRLMEGHSPEDGVPSSKRIIEDCDRALTAMRIVCEHKGAIVPGLADRNGIRYAKEGTNGRGGPREKCRQLQAASCVHPSVTSLVNEKRKEVVSKFNHSFECDVEDENESDVESDAEEF